jgi:hypothetical protein
VDEPAAGPDQAEGAADPGTEEVQPQAYTQETAFEPFSNQKLTQALKRETTAVDLQRRAARPRAESPQGAARGLPAGRDVHGRQPGQAGPAGRAGPVDNLLYQVRPGNYLGQNYGKITKVGRGRRRAARNRAGRRGRMDRAHRDAPIAREVEMNKRTSWRGDGSSLAWGGCSSRGPACRPSAQSTVVESVSSSLQGGVEVVRIDFSQPLTRCRPASPSSRPRASRSTSPAPATAWAATSVELNQGNLRSVNVVQAGDRTRLVLNLKPPPATRRSCRASRCWCRWTRWRAPAGGHVGNGAVRREPQPRRPADQGPGLPPRPRRAGRVIVELPNNQVGVDIRQQGQHPGGRIPEVDAARRPAPQAGRVRLRHAGADRHHLPGRRPRARGHRAQGPVGTQRLPERQPVRGRSAPAEGRPDQADARAPATRARSCR